MSELNAAAAALRTFALRIAPDDQKTNIFILVCFYF